MSCFGCSHGGGSFALSYVIDGEIIHELVEETRGAGTRAQQNACLPSTLAEFHLGKSPMLRFKTLQDLVVRLSSRCIHSPVADVLPQESRRVVVRPAAAHWYVMPAAGVQSIDTVMIMQLRTRWRRRRSPRAD